MTLEFFKFSSVHLQYLSFFREEGIAFSTLFWKLKGVTLFVGKMPRLRGSKGKFLLKNEVLGVSRLKKKKLFPQKAFCLFVVAETFFEVALYLETYSVPRTLGCTLGQTP